MRTRAAVLLQVGLPHPYEESRPLAIEEVELASPGRDEVLVRIRAAGLCHALRSGRRSSEPVLQHRGALCDDLHHFLRHQRRLRTAIAWPTLEDGGGHLSLGDLPTRDTPQSDTPDSTPTKKGFPPTIPRSAWLAAAVSQRGERLVTFDRDFRRLLGRAQMTVLAPR